MTLSMAHCIWRPTSTVWQCLGRTPSHRWRQSQRVRFDPGVWQCPSVTGGTQAHTFGQCIHALVPEATGVGSHQSGGGGFKCDTRPPYRSRGIERRPSRRHAVDSAQPCPQQCPTQSASAPLDRTQGAHQVQAGQVGRLAACWTSAFVARGASNDARARAPHTQRGAPPPINSTSSRPQAPHTIHTIPLPSLWNPITTDLVCVCIYCCERELERGAGDSTLVIIAPLPLSSAAARPSPKHGAPALRRPGDGLRSAAGRGAAGGLGRRRAGGAVLARAPGARAAARPRPRPAAGPPDPGRAAGERQR